MSITFSMYRTIMLAVILALVFPACAEPGEPPFFLGHRLPASYFEAIDVSTDHVLTPLEKKLVIDILKQAREHTYQYPTLNRPMEQSRFYAMLLHNEPALREVAAATDMFIFDLVSFYEDNETSEGQRNRLLVESCKKGNADAVLEMLTSANPPDANGVSMGEWTPLCMAVAWRSYQDSDRYRIISVLLDHGADPNMEVRKYNYWRSSPIETAINRDDLRAFTILFNSKNARKDTVSINKYKSIAMDEKSTGILSFLDNLPK